jgi:hypothetical protein
MSGAITPLPQYAFMAWCLVKHRDNFTFTLPYLFACLLHIHQTEKSRPELHYLSISLMEISGVKHLSFINSKNNFPCCFLQFCNLVSHTKGRIQNQGV